MLDLSFSFRRDKIDVSWLSPLLGKCRVYLFGWVGYVHLPAYGGRPRYKVRYISWEDAGFLIEKGFGLEIPVQDSWTGWKERLNLTLKEFEKRGLLEKTRFVVALPEAYRYLKRLGIQAVVSCVHYSFTLYEAEKILEMSDDAVVTLPPNWSFRRKDLERLAVKGYAERIKLFVNGNCMATCKFSRCHHMFIINAGGCMKREMGLKRIDKKWYFGIKPFYEMGYRKFKFVEHWSEFTDRFERELREIGVYS